MWDKFVEDCVPWEKVHAGAGENCKDEGAAEVMCDELTANPMSHSLSPCSAQEEEVEKIGSKVEPRKKGGLGGRCLALFFHYPTPI